MFRGIFLECKDNYFHLNMKRLGNKSVQQYPSEKSFHYFAFVSIQ